jgi:hypothetical protein
MALSVILTAVTLKEAALARPTIYPLCLAMTWPVTSKPSFPVITPPNARAQAPVARKEVMVKFTLLLAVTASFAYKLLLRRPSGTCASGFRMSETQLPVQPLNDGGMVIVDAEHGMRAEGVRTHAEEPQQHTLFIQQHSSESTIARMSRCRIDHPDAT